MAQAERKPKNRAGIVKERSLDIMSRRISVSLWLTLAAGIKCTGLLMVDGRWSMVDGRMKWGNEGMGEWGNELSIAD